MLDALGKSNSIRVVVSARDPKRTAEEAIRASLNLKARRGDPTAILGTWDTGASRSSRPCTFRW